MVDEGGRTVDAIQAYLEEHDWVPEGGEGWRWVDHVFDNGHGTLSVDFLPSTPHRIGFGFENQDHEARLLIAFENDPREVLDPIVRHQRDLSGTTWPEFIRAVLASSPNVVSVTQDAGGSETTIRTPEEGVQALREIDWEYVDEGTDDSEVEDE